jgi:hypothetical protein
MHRFSEIVPTSPCAFKIDLTDGYARETARRQRALGKRTVGRLLRLPNIPEYSELQGNLDARYQVANPSLRYLLSQQSQPSPIMKRPAALWNWAG